MQVITLCRCMLQVWSLRNKKEIEKKYCLCVLQLGYERPSCITAKQPHSLQCNITYNHYLFILCSEQHFEMYIMHFDEDTFVIPFCL